MHKKDQRLLKKILISALAINPDSFGLVPDEKGWVKLKELAKTISQEQGFKHITTKTIEQFILLWERDSFELDTKNKKIRIFPFIGQNFKNQNFNYEVTSPPQLLFIAIRPKACQHILKNGFSSKNDPIVFSCSKELALRRGKWIHNNPILVTIKAYEASNSGAIFYKAGQKLFLSYYIGPEYIYIEGGIPKTSQDKEKEKANFDKSHRMEAPKVETMGSFFMSSDFSFENKKKSSKFKKDKRHKKDPDWKRIRRQKRRR